MNKYDVLILNFWPRKNMGGTLQAWALQNLINQLGYTNALINYQPTLIKEWFKNGFTERFSKKYLTITELCDTDTKLNNLNTISDTFILGGDCIWKYWWWWYMCQQHTIFMGSFINPDKKIISYAPSFGNKTYEDTNNDILTSKYYLKKIDHISVRENTGLDILKNTFDIDNGVQTLDSTLVLSKDKFDELASKSKYNKTDYIFNYSIGIKEDDNAYKKVMDLAKNENVFTLSQDKLDNIDVEDWLYLIKNAKLLITNSYHACCLAIKFNVPFYTFAPYGLDTTRFDSLLGMLNLENRILRTEEDVEQIKDIYEPINWEKVNEKIKTEAEFSINWLKTALEAKKDLSKINLTDVIIQNLNHDIVKLNDKVSNTVTLEEMHAILNYRRNYRKYLKYKILKNFVFGEKREKYKEKQLILHEKIRSARQIKKGL